MTVMIEEMTHVLIIERDDETRTAGAAAPFEAAAAAEAEAETGCPQLLHLGAGAGVPLLCDRERGRDTAPYRDTLLLQEGDATLPRSRLPLTNDARWPNPPLLRTKKIPGTTNQQVPYQRRKRRLVLLLLEPTTRWVAVLRNVTHQPFPLCPPPQTSTANEWGVVAANNWYTYRATLLPLPPANFVNVFSGRKL